MSLNRFLPAEAFYAQVKQMLATAEPGCFALVSMDFDNFNYINDLFGYDVGDEVLRRLSARFQDHLNDGEFFSRLHADHFAFWLRVAGGPDLAARLEGMMQSQDDLNDLLPPYYSLVSSSGIIRVTAPRETLSSLLDKANFARKHIKGSFSSTVLTYDRLLEEDLAWRKAITLDMKSALQHRQFEMYLQPKFHIQSGRAVGAEALVRWNSPTHGLVYPDRFIPILEQNGFIRQIDFFMLEEACALLQRCHREGRPLLPISVNFSKVHLQSDGFVDRIFHTAERYGVPTELLEIELTENIYLEDSMTLAGVIRTLKNLGFRVSLDDFGSAYSSLGCLKDLPVDIIKIDKGFLQASSHSDKGRIVIAKMVELIKSLRMVSVIEGVETLDQVEFLQRLSCDLGQGYYYARPMPVADYLNFLSQGAMVQTAALEALAPEADPPTFCNVVPQEFQMDSWELFTLGQNIDMGLMKGNLDGDFTVQYVNDIALQYIGYSRHQFQTELHNSILAFTHPKDMILVEGNIRQLMQTGAPLAFRSRALRRDGTVITLQGRASCVADAHGRPVGIYAFQDITEDLAQTEALQHSLEEKIVQLEERVASERASQEALRMSEERYRLIVEQSNDIMFEWNFADDSIQFSDKYQQVFQREPITEHFSQNPAVRLRIHPDDWDVFDAWVSNVYHRTECVQVELRFLLEDGGQLWIRCRSTPIMDEDDRPVRAVGVFSNIDQIKTQMDRLTRKSQLDCLTQLYNKEETQLRIESALLNQPDLPASFFIIDVDNFKGLNDSLGHQMGDTVLVDVADKIRRIFRDTDVVGRIGGDEIAVFTRGLSDVPTLTQKARQLIQTVRITYQGADGSHAVSASVGIARYPQDGSSFAELYRLADLALYDSKRRGKDRYALYRGSMSARARIAP